MKEILSISPEIQKTVGPLGGKLIFFLSFGIHFVSQDLGLLTNFGIIILKTFPSIFNISLITGWTVYTEKYKARGPDV